MASLAPGRGGPAKGGSSLKISQRVQNLAESATIAVSNKAAQLRAEGIDVVSFGAGEPDFDTPTHVKQAAWQALQAGETKYAKPAHGIPALKQAIVNKLRRENGLEYDPTQVIVSVGGKEALWLACATLLDPGDEVIVPAPYWVSYPEQVELNGGLPVIVDYCGWANQQALEVEPDVVLVSYMGEISTHGQADSRIARLRVTDRGLELDH